jgi:hypothetical protein
MSNDPNFENNIKNAFSSVKEDMDILKLEIDKNKERIIELVDLIKTLISEKNEKTQNFEEIEPNEQYFIKSSIGNQGVQSINQSSINQSINHPFAIIDVIEALSRGQLLALLTLYQLEDEKEKVTYSDIADKISLTESCVRSYISMAIKKKAPIKRNRINNRLTYLSIDKKFRELGLKPKLVSLYYQMDPDQKRLSDI